MLANSAYIKRRGWWKFPCNRLLRCQYATRSDVLWSMYISRRTIMSNEMDRLTVRNHVYDAIRVDVQCRIFRVTADCTSQDQKRGGPRSRLCRHARAQRRQLQLTQRFIIKMRIGTLPMWGGRHTDATSAFSIAPVCKQDGSIRVYHRSWIAHARRIPLSCTST